MMLPQMPRKKLLQLSNLKDLKYNKTMKKKKTKLKIAVPHAPTGSAMMTKHQQMARTALPKAKGKGKTKMPRKMIYGAL